MIRSKRLESPSLTRRVSSRYVCPIFVVVDLVCPDTWPESPFREVCPLPLLHLCFTAFTTQCQGPGCGTHPPARAFTHMCLASSHVLSPKFLSSSFLLQPHDTVFTGCLLRDGCGTNPRPPGPSPTLSGFFQMPSSPKFHSSSSLLQLNDTAFTRCHSETCATHPRRPGPSPILFGFFTYPHLHLYFRRRQPSGSLYGTLT